MGISTLNSLTASEVSVEDALNRDVQISASRVFFTVTTRKRRSKQVISIHWKRLVAFFVIMVIFRCLTEYGLRTKNCQIFLSLFAKLDIFQELGINHLKGQGIVSSHFFSLLL